MAHLRKNPETLFDAAQFGFSQVVVSEGSKTVYCSGQTGWTPELGFPDGSDFASQTRSVLKNIGLALQAAGATPADVVRIQTSVVNLNDETVPVLTGLLTEFFGVDSLPASTLVGVQRLSMPDFLVEIEVTAVI